MRKLILSISIISFCIACNSKKEIPSDNTLDVIDSVAIDSTLLKEAMSLEHPDSFDERLVYTVQVGAYSQSNREIEEDGSVIISDEGDDLVRYRFGQFDSYQEAQGFKNNMLGLYPDAFIVPINQGIRIDIREALVISNETEYLEQ